MDETATYIGVTCRNCGSKIAVQPLTWADEAKTTINIPLVEWPIKAHCKCGGQTHQYEQRDRIQFDGPVPPHSN